MECTRKTCNNKRDTKNRKGYLKMQLIYNQQQHVFKSNKAHNTYGCDRIKSNVLKHDYDIRKLKAENERIKKSLTEKHLENAMLSKSLKSWIDKGILYEYIN